MGLRLILQEGDVFYVGPSKFTLIECYDIGRTSVQAVFLVEDSSGTSEIVISGLSGTYVYPDISFRILQGGSAARNILQIVITAPKSIFIQRENYDG